MRVVFSEGAVTLYREDGDPKFYGNREAKGEHSLLRYLAKFLNARGFDVIKKRAQKDGHMIGDQYQPYLRTRKPCVCTPHIYVWSGFYALHGANEDWNKGEVELLVESDCFEKGQDTQAMIAALCVSAEMTCK